MSEKTLPAYISKVHLKGYKSIRDVEIDLLPGLNIIIGPNGSGKTNFLEFLFNTTNLFFDKFKEPFEGRITIKEKQTKEWLIKGGHFEIDADTGQPKQKIELGISLHEQKLKKYSFSSSNLRFLPLTEDILKLKAKLDPFIKIDYGYPENVTGLNQFFSLKFEKGKQIKLSQGSLVPEDLNHFLVFVLGYNFIKNGSSKTSKITIKKLKSLEKEFEFQYKFLDDLKYYSPVKNIRIAPGYSFQEDSENINISNLIFEFFVDGKWWSWNKLSDGTKRMFYIISEITFFEKGIYLIEEPELGVHPHQLLKLMDFIVQEIKTGKQIIITTHSPQLLNYLKTNELDRIIISKYDHKDGSQFFRLDSEQREIAVAYMLEEGLWLSDYWMHSDLEKEEEL